MIRWWRPDGGPLSGRRWTWDWCRVWARAQLAAGRPCLVARARLGERPVEEVLAGRALPDVGGRVVIGLVVPVDRLPAADVGHAIDGAGLVPEVPHGSDPFPGDRRLAGFAGADPAADLGLGCVLVRRLTAADVAGRVFDVVPGPHPAARWAGLTEDEDVPVPVPPGRWPGPRLAAAYRVDEEGFAVLATELVVSGVLRVGPPSGG